MVDLVEEVVLMTSLEVEALEDRCGRWKTVSRSFVALRIWDKCKQFLNTKR